MALRFLIVEDDDDIREIISMHLSDEFGAEILTAAGGKEAITILAKTPKIDCIVSDYKMPNGSGGELFAHLKSVSSKIPFILCSGNDLSSMPEFSKTPPDFLISKPSITGPLSEIIRKIPFPKVSLDITRQEYFTVKSKSLLRVGELPVPVFLRLTEEKYVKILSEGDFFNIDDFEKYSLKKIDVFYILSTDRERFFNHWLSDLDNFEKIKDIPPSEFDQLAVKSIQNIHLLIGELGADPEIQKKITKTAELAIRSVCAEPSLLKLMKRILADPDHYVTQHSLSVGHISCLLAGNMGWKSDTTLMKLQVAAMLHDVTLTTQDLNRVKELDELEVDVSTMNAVERSFFKSHPLQAAVLAQEFKQLPPEVDQIIRQHHELPDGSGFPEGISHQKISPLSCVFILAHRLYAFSTNRNAPEPDQVISQFIKSIPASFQVGEFKKVLTRIKEPTKI